MTDPLVAFDAWWAAYPRQYGIGAARRQWMWALAKVDNDHDKLIRAAADYAAYCRREGLEERYILAPAKWFIDEHWLDQHVQPAAAADPQEARLSRLASFWRNGQAGNKFSQGLFERDATNSDRTELARRGVLQ